MLLEFHELEGILSTGMILILYRCLPIMIGALVIAWAAGLFAVVLGSSHRNTSDDLQ